MTRRKKDAPPAEYKVGKGKPPLHTRYAPGQSGNPGGRPKGRSNLTTILQAVLSSEIEISENGTKRSAPVLEALLKRQVHAALKGELRAIENLLDRAERHMGDEPEPDMDLTEEDKTILERVLSRGAGRSAQGGGAAQGGAAGRGGESQPKRRRERGGEDEQH